MPELRQRFKVAPAPGTAALATVIAGYVSARRRTAGWKVRHACFMGGSHVGLIAALTAEVRTRTPWLGFLPAVGLASAAVFAIGLYLMFRHVPRLLQTAASGPLTLARDDRRILQSVRNGTAADSGSVS